MSKHNPEEEEHIQLLKLDSSPATGDSDDSDTETSSSTSSGQRRAPSHTDNNTYEIEGEVYTHEDLHPSTFSEIRAVGRSYKQILLMTIVATIAIAAGAISATSHDHNGDGSYRTNAMGGKWGGLGSQKEEVVTTQFAHALPPHSQNRALIIIYWGRTTACTSRGTSPRRKSR